MSVTIYRLYNTLTGCICKRDFEKLELGFFLRPFSSGAGKLDLHNGA